MKYGSHSFSVCGKPEKKNWLYTIYEVWTISNEIKSIKYVCLKIKVHRCDPLESDPLPQLHTGYRVFPSFCNISGRLKELNCLGVPSSQHSGISYGLRMRSFQDQFCWWHIRRIDRLWQHWNVFRVQKPWHTEATMTWNIVMMKDPRFGNPWTASNDSFSQPIKYFPVEILVDGLYRWCELFLHDPFTVKEEIIIVFTFD